MNELTGSIFRDCLKWNEGVYAITGGAGAGKTGMMQLLKITLAEKNYTIISLDDYFIGDSEYRKLLLKSKESNWEDFIDACNQYNWWNWDKILEVLRETHKKCDLILVDGAILGPLIPFIDFIYFLKTDSLTRFNRLTLRDGKKRSFEELIHRFLITEYSENLYIKNYLLKVKHKLGIMNGAGNYTTKDISIGRDEVFLPLGVKL